MKTELVFLMGALSIASRKIAEKIYETDDGGMPALHDKVGPCYRSDAAQNGSGEARREPDQSGQSETGYGPSMNMMKSDGQYSSTKLKRLRSFPAVAVPNGTKDLVVEIPSQESRKGEAGLKYPLVRSLIEKMPHDE